MAVRHSPLFATAVALFAPALCAGCGQSERDDDGGGGASGDAAVSFDPMPVDGSSCGAVVQHHPIEPTAHVDYCSPIQHTTNPPSSGNHYGSWGAFGEYDLALPRGFWIHNMEHGAVVAAYDCPAGCPADLSAAKAWLGNLMVDVFCATQGETEPRAILVPDPLLPTRWAAAAWGWTLRADCFELQVFETFYLEHVGHGPENICSARIDFRNPDGGLAVPASCGTATFDAGVRDAAR